MAACPHRPRRARGYEVRALPAERPLWVRFPGESLEKVTKLRLDGRSMLEAADYQIPYVPSDLKPDERREVAVVAGTAPKRYDWADQSWLPKVEPKSKPSRLVRR